MKILWFNWRDIQNPEAGGAEVYTHEIAKRLVKKGHSVTLFTANHCRREESVNKVNIVRRGGKPKRAAIPVTKPQPEKFIDMEQKNSLLLRRDRMEMRIISNSEQIHHRKRMDSKCKVSVVIPTYNEAENIAKLIPLASEALRDYQHELIVVDDSSPDGTAEVVEKLGEEYPMRLLVRDGKLGLASAILYGFRNADGDVFGVIDADLQHPPLLITTIVSKIMDGYDVAIASRSVKGGGVEDWSFYRRLVSKSAIMLARPLTRVKDPMSGYFFLKRSVIDGVHLSPKGYKLLLEILVKGRYEKVAEVPYVFTKRIFGESKLKPSEYWKYLKLLAHLYKAKFLQV